MSIDLDDATFQRILETTGTDRPLSKDAIRGIVHLAQLAAWIDLKEDPAPMRLLETITSRLCTRAGIYPDTIRPISPVPIDAEERATRLLEVTRELTDGQELAYALAYLVVASDMELAPVESELLERAATALGLGPDRAQELTMRVSQLVTPSETAA